MFRFIIISLTAILLSSCAANRGFIADNADSTVSKHRKIAILPFKVEFNEQIKRTSRRGGRQQEGYWQEQARIAGLDMQRAMFVSVAQQVEKGRIEKVIQNFTQTNSLLEQNSIPIYAIPDADPQAIGNILGVDGILRGTTQVEADFNGMMMGGMNNGTTTLLELYDTATGQLIWSETVTRRPNGPMDTPQRMAQMAADDLSKMLPYRMRR